MIKAIGQITIRDENDITVGAIAPTSPVDNQMWLDTSKKPSVLKRYISGVWEIVNETSVVNRNYFLRSKDNYIDTTVEVNKIFEISDDFIGAIRGKYITVSAYIEGTFKETQQCHYGIDICIHYADGETAWCGLNRGDFGVTENPDGSKTIEGKRYHTTDFIKDKEISLIDNLRIFIRNTESVTRFIIKDIKIEIGNKATEYEKAPEDIETKVESNTTTLNVVQGNISALISDNTIIKGNINTINSNYAALNIKVDGINTSVGSQNTTIQTIQTGLNQANSSLSNALTQLGTVENGLNTANNNLNTMSGEVQTVKNKQTTLEQSLDGFRTTVDNTYSKKTELSSLDGRVTSLASTISSNTSQINQMKDSINLKVDSAYVDEKVERLTLEIEDSENLITSVDARLKSAEQKITDDAIISTVSSSISQAKTEVLNVVTTRMTNLSNMISDNSSQINQMKDSIDLKVSSTYVDEKIGQIKLGNNNLYKNTKEFNPSVDSSLWWKSATTSASEYNPTERYIDENGNDFAAITISSKDRIYQKAEVEGETTYTLSAYIRVNSGVNNPYINYSVNSAMVLDSNIPRDTHTGVYKRYSVTFKTYSNTTLSDCGFINLNSNSSYTICGFKLEKGSFATSWTCNYTDFVSNENLSSINNSLTNLSVRLSSAEQKITDDAIISTVSTTVSTAKSEAINTANTNTNNLLKNYYNISQTESKIEQSNSGILAKVVATNKYLSKNVIPYGSFESGGAYGLGSWNKNTISASVGRYSGDNVAWCNFYTSTTAEELYAYQEITVENGKNYDFSFRVAKYGSTAQLYRVRIQEYKNSAWTTVKEFTGTVDGDRDNPLVITGKYKATTTQARIWVGKLDTEKFDIYLTDFQLYYDVEIVKKSELQVLSDSIASKVSTSDFNSSITQLSNSISSKVSSGEISTYIQQNSSAVKIAWNNSSQYVQFEAGGLAIYNGSVTTSQKRAYFDERGTHFWRDGYYLGKMGTNMLSSDSSKKGIVFDLEYDAAYMTWAAEDSSTASTYSMKWTYVNKGITGYTSSGRLYAGCDLDMTNHTLRNVTFEGGGINGTMNFVQIKSMSSDGTVATWSNNCKLVFQNGILVDGTWGN